MSADSRNVFISWSGPRSEHAAKAFYELLPMIVPTAQPWLSAADIDKGTQWRQEIGVALNVMKAGIICLTPDNLTSPWLLFEAGALSKALDAKSYVWTYLLAGLEHGYLKDPLAMFQSTKPESEDTRKLIHDIQKSLDPSVPEARLNKLFDKFWPDLDKELKAAAAMPGPKPRQPESNEMLSQILEGVRSLQTTTAEINRATNLSRRLELHEVRNAIAHGRTNALAAESPTTPTTVSVSEMLGKIPTAWLNPEAIKVAGFVDESKLSAADWSRLAETFKDTEFSDRLKHIAEAMQESPTLSSIEAIGRAVRKAHDEREETKFRVPKPAAKKSDPKTGKKD